MRTGTLISGAAHAALIAAAIFGLPWFSPKDREPVRVTSVSFISESEFAAAQSAAGQPGETAPVIVEPPEVAEEPELPIIEPEVAEQVEPEAPVELSNVAPQFNPTSPLQPPRQDLSSAIRPLEAPFPSTIRDAPAARPVDRIDQVLTPPPPDLSRPAEVAILEALPVPEPEVQQPERQEEAPPEAVTEPVAEPVQEAPVAQETVAPPPSRPVRLASVVPDPVPAPEEPEPEPAPEPEPETPETTQQSRIEELVAAAAGATAPTPPTPPTPAEQGTPITQATAAAGSGFSDGPPLSAAERDGFKFAVQDKWVVPAGLRDAQKLRVVIAAEMAENGEIVVPSIRLIDPVPVPDGRYQRAFDAGRRALIRGSPYTDLPREKYARWRRIEVVFDPRGMVSW